jgi:hypothetical protein
VSKPFYQSVACSTRHPCADCLAHRWHGMDACPHGVTAANLPTPQHTEREQALQAQARGEVYAPPGRCRGCGS